MIVPVLALCQIFQHTDRQNVIGTVKRTGRRFLLGEICHGLIAVFLVGCDVVNIVNIRCNAVMHQCFLIAHIPRFIMAVSYVADFLMPAGNQIIHCCQCDFSAVAQDLVHFISGGVAVDRNEIFLIAFQRFQSFLRAFPNENQPVVLLLGIMKHLCRRLFDF